MLFHPRTPFILGAIVITFLGWVLLQYSPMPRPLSAAHAGLAGVSTLDGCESCHHEEGIATGCLACHGEIDAQIRERRGFHHFLLAGGPPRCAPCHEEHGGPAQPLVTDRSWGAQVEAAFRHPHTDFKLLGAHERLPCEECHISTEGGVAMLAGFADHKRGRTYIGLDQDCIECHDDIHSDGLSGACDRCHGQDAFRPPVLFDHNAHFPLEGGHAGLICADCHILPPPRSTPREPPFPFHRVRGKTCDSCHESPHFASFSSECAACHEVSDPKWSSAIAAMTPEMHAETGFRLDSPHANVPCRECHTPDLPFVGRYNDPAAPGYSRDQNSCQGCHEDAHAGQFLARHDRCADCHGEHGFLPPAFGHDAHASVWPLEGAHPGVACTSCHTPHADLGVRRFAGTPQECKDCHESPHGEQFQARIEESDCDSCHLREAIAFRIRPFDHGAITGYALEGAHAAADCADCHVERPTFDAAVGGPVRIRQFTGTPATCHSCHRDIHHGQFAVGGREDCARCHASFTDWKDLQFDHDRDSRFPLIGVHATLECSRCHLPAEAAGGVDVVIYRPIGRECRDCHDVGLGSLQR